MVPELFTVVGEEHEDRVLVFAEEQVDLLQELVDETDFAQVLGPCDVTRVARRRILIMVIAFVERRVDVVEVEVDEKRSRAIQFVLPVF